MAVAASCCLALLALLRAAARARRIDVRPVLELRQHNLVVRLRFGELELARVVSECTLASCGAIATFSGTTRDSFEGRTVTSLAYEAYEPMALKEMAKACQSARAQWPDLERVVVEHKLGQCPVTATSLLVVVAAPHRASALDAVRFIVDELKRATPIWKLEVYAQGAAAWKENASGGIETQM